MSDLIYDPTITPVGCDILEDARALRAAMKGFGTDEDAIIAILTKRSAEQRGQIAQEFKNEFGRDLIKDLKSELGGKLEKLVLALMDPPFDYLANQLHRAMDKIGTNEDVLTEILCTRGNEEIHYIKEAYERLYGKNLEDEISSEVSGDYKRLLVMLLTVPTTSVSSRKPRLELNCSRYEHVEPENAADMAASLYDAGEGKLGTDEEAFTTMLAHNSFPQLKLVFEEYENLSGKTFEQAVKSELDGDLKEACLTIARRAISLPRYFAERLKEAMKGAGTDDDALIRIIVTRSEIDLEAIKKEYMALYHKTLESAIKSETSGDYEKCLLSILEGNM